jgi:hypothetical protein
MTRCVRVSQLVLVLAAGVLSAVALAGCGNSDAGRRIRTVIENITIPRRTVTTAGSTQTLQQTVTRTAVTTSVPAAETSSSGLPLWAWIAIAVGAACLVVLLVWLVRRPRKLGVEERRRLVVSAAASWIAQGWAIEQQSDDSAVLHRDGQRLLLRVDARGRIVTSVPPAAAGPQ